MISFAKSLLQLSTCYKSMWSRLIKRSEFQWFEATLNILKRIKELELNWTSFQHDFQCHFMPFWLMFLCRVLSEEKNNGVGWCLCIVSKCSVDLQCNRKIINIKEWHNSFVEYIENVWLILSRLQVGSRVMRK